MDALTEMVDAFGGVEVYVPQNMRYYNEKTGAFGGELLQGWRTLLGGDCEFFLRYRQGLPRSDLDRLVMQRQFYTRLVPPPQKRRLWATSLSCCPWRRSISKRTFPRWS